jgi:hypothetical protein
MTVTIEAENAPTSESFDRLVSMARKEFLSSGGQMEEAAMATDLSKADQKTFERIRSLQEQKARPRG